MTEHVTNSERMNAFLSALAAGNEGPLMSPAAQSNSSSSLHLINQEKNRRREMILIYGEAAEIFEDSLASFATKIVLYFQKILKEHEPFYHNAVGEALSKLVEHTLCKLSDDDIVASVQSILRIFY